jgi:primosomal protein N' (replication factor Y) (superfamily II helicase)
MGAARLVDVALPAPLFRAFTYAVPPALEMRAVAGARVVAPLGGRRVVGVVLGDADPARDVPKGLKPLMAAPDAEPAFDATMLALARWISDYYATPLGLVLKAMLPAALSTADTPAPSGRTTRVLELAQRLDTLMERDRAFARAPKQRGVYELLESVGGRAPATHVRTQLGVSDAVLEGLVTKGHARWAHDAAPRDPFAARPVPRATPHVPTAAQAEALAALSATAPGATVLLHGITGSGKTLVYLEFLRQVVEARGRGAIVLVPEIALTPQTVDRFRAVFGDRVAVLHSGLSDGERLDAWRALAAGTKRIAVGPRSAVFAPVRDLGAIVVDEEHEQTYKQHETPRYHARDVAVMRARLTGAVCVLGSATPSLESWVNADAGRYARLALPERAGAGRLPEVEIVDLTRLPPSPDPLRRVLSPALEEALEDTLRRGDQAILLLNRRGYAAFIQCPSCGDVATCPQCAISLTYHRAPERLLCHYCQHVEPTRSTCTRCGATTLARRGIGTQQLEQLLAERFPRARLARMDVDTTAGKWAHAEILDRVARREVDLLFGTQMIAKGLDFPDVTLVGVVDADTGINLPDFRASERCFQLLAQVAGRAGRGAKGGRVIIQTRSPGHHAVQCAVTHDYHAFVLEELSGRRFPAYPPTVRLANVIVSGLEPEAVHALAEAAAEWWRSAIAARGLSGLLVLGPAPSPVERIQARWRWHLLVKSEQPAPLSKLARAFVARFPVPPQHGLRVAFDRDPTSLL